MTTFMYRLRVEHETGPVEYVGATDWDAAKRMWEQTAAMPLVKSVRIEQRKTEAWQPASSELTGTLVGAASRPSGATQQTIDQGPGLTTSAPESLEERLWMAEFDASAARSEQDTAVAAGRADQTQRIVKYLERHYAQHTVCSDFRDAIELIKREFGPGPGL